MEKQPINSEKIRQLWEVNKPKITISLGSLSFFIYAIFRIIFTENKGLNDPILLQSLFFAAGILSLGSAGFIVLISIPMWVWGKIAKRKKKRVELLERITELENELLTLRKHERFTSRIKDIIRTAHVEQELGVKDAHILMIDTIIEILREELETEE